MNRVTCSIVLCVVVTLYCVVPLQGVPIDYVTRNQRPTSSTTTTITPPIAETVDDVELFLLPHTFPHTPAHMTQPVILLDDNLSLLQIFTLHKNIQDTQFRKLSHAAKVSEDNTIPMICHRIFDKSIMNQS